MTTSPTSTEELIDFDHLDGCLWPDPDPQKGASLRLNDVSGLSETPVDRIFFPQNEQDVVTILQQALQHGKRVGIRGTSHSMGGHSLQQGGYILDLQFLNHYELLLGKDANNDECLLKVGTGCTWADVIRVLNPIGKSPSVLQSYCNFSVGGTLSVNAHGITSDDCMASCVQSFRLVHYNKEGQVKTSHCHPGDELFGLALGGYGLFGVIVEATLTVTDNSDLLLDSFQSLKLIPDEKDEGGVSEFERIYDAIRVDPSVDIKLARLNILTLETASLYVFRKDDDESSGSLSAPVSHLPARPNELSPVGRLLYKWALPLLKDYRQYREDTNGKSLDMPPHSHETTRNEVLWESATPLAKLYSPLLVSQDSFILQEFFVPHEQFQPWIRQVRPIFREIDMYQREGCAADLVPPQSLILLNTTIRYVNYDEVSTLAYSRHSDGMYAFVLYYRIQKTAQVEKDLGTFHNRLAEVAVRLGGTFYLPYRNCYDVDLLKGSFPCIDTFARKKELHDPLGVFSNAWFEHYILRMCSSIKYQMCWGKGVDCAVVPSQEPLSTLLSKEEFEAWLPRLNDPTLERRHDSYRKLLHNRQLRKQFENEFLVHVFNIADPADVMRIMSRAMVDPRHKNDSDIYQVMFDHFQSQASELLVQLQQGWSSLRQLCRQKRELAHETAAILHRLGIFGSVRSYLSVGDHGKTVRILQEAGVLDDSSYVWVAHDFKDEDEMSLNVVAERCSLDPVGTKVNFDYLQDAPCSSFSRIPTHSIDLVTVNQGLHHFPPSKLYDFLLELRRMLRPGGILLFREHDLRLGEEKSATNTPVPMLDLAHSVFNAVTGVPRDEEAAEIRAFRPLSEWRMILRNTGFSDGMLYGLQESDCTCDFMMCFFNESPVVEPTKMISNNIVHSNQLEHLHLPMFDALEALLSQIPSSIAAFVQEKLGSVLDRVSGVGVRFDEFFLHQLPEALLADDEIRKWLDVEQCHDLNHGLHRVLKSWLGKVGDFGDGARALLDAAQVRKVSNVGGLLSMKELWLVLPLLERRATLQSDKDNPYEKMLLTFVREKIPDLLRVGQGQQEMPAKPDHLRTPLVQTPSGDRGNDLVEPQEVLEVVTLLRDKIPSISDPKQVLAHSGFSFKEQSVLIGVFGATDLQGFAEKIASVHDKLSWDELRRALVGPDDRSVLQDGELPTKAKLFSKEGDHPWHQALLSFLKGPGVVLTQRTVLGIQMLGLKDLVTLYNESKAASSSQRADQGEISLGLGTDATATLHTMTKKVSCDDEVKSVTIEFSKADEILDLFDVGEVTSASYGYKSLTASPTDVTEQMRDLHRDVQGPCSRRGRWHSSMVKLLEERPTGCIGWLPVREEILHGFRKKGSAYQIGDSMRRVVVSAGSLGLAGANKLWLQYRPVNTSVKSQDVDTLCEFAREVRLVDPTFHQDDGHFMWFKLPEWMQVEIVSKLALSLDHTPWYYFPFKEFMATYFRVLGQTCRVVANEHGLVKAYGSVPFLYDLVPGIIMSAIFGQLQLLAAPLAAVLPTPNDDVMVEEILFIMPFVEDAQDHLHSIVDYRIRSLHFLCQPPGSGTGLFRMVLPTYKAMGEIMIKLGTTIPSARILQISNQTTVQVALVATLKQSDQSSLPEKITAEINSIDGLEVLTQFQYPMDNVALRMKGEETARETHLVVKAQVFQLLTLIRLASSHDGITVKQIYDFWA